MDPERRREIVRLGGLTAHTNGHGHKWTPEQARAAGRTGGLKSKRGPAKSKTPPAA